MKTEARVFLGVTAFFVVIGVVYWFTSYEDAGAVMLAAAALMGLLAGSAIWLLSRHAPLRPEDRADASPTAALPNGGGAVDELPSPSIWPFAVGASGALLASGFAFGVWLMLVGGGAFALALAGMAGESRRNEAAGGREG